MEVCWPLRRGKAEGNLTVALRRADGMSQGIEFALETDPTSDLSGDVPSLVQDGDFLADFSNLNVALEFER